MSPVLPQPGEPQRKQTMYAKMLQLYWCRGSQVQLLKNVFAVLVMMVAAQLERRPEGL